MNWLRHVFQAVSVSQMCKPFIIHHYHSEQKVGMSLYNQYTAQVAVNTSTNNFQLLVALIVANTHYISTP